MELAGLVRVSATIAGSRSRNAKRDALVQLLQRLARDEVLVGVSYLVGQLPQGRIGIGPATLRAAAQIAPALAPSLTLRDVDATLERMLGIAGKGAAHERQRMLAALFARATHDEQSFLIRLMLGELRQGAVEGVMIEAIAAAVHCTPQAVRRAIMLSGDVPAVAASALHEGAVALDRYRLTPGSPVRPMLAQVADDAEHAIAALHDAVLDYKVDGARVQVHKHGNDVAVFSRRLNDVTASVPELVDAVTALPASSLVLDGEAIALDTRTRRPLPFQITMRRFGRTQDVARMREQLPLAVFFFDCLHADGADLLDTPTESRLAHLDERLPARLVMPRTVASEPAAATAFLGAALAAGHEGIMAKHPRAPYEAGSRGGAWLKVKSAHTLDLVVLAAEWGSGRRRGWLSNLHLGARDPASGGFVMLGKTFKGLTDRMLAWQTQALLEREIARDAATIYVRPEIVVEVAFNDVQTSPQYPAGMALRFARVKAFRTDKQASDADTVDTVRALHRQAGRGPLRSDP